jgi:hypothetical protein
MAFDEKAIIVLLSHRIGDVVCMKGIIVLNL